MFELPSWFQILCHENFFFSTILKLINLIDPGFDFFSRTLILQMNLKWLFDSQYFETLTNRDELTIEYVKICMCKQGKDIVVRMSKDIASNDDTSD